MKSGFGLLQRVQVTGAGVPAILHHQYCSEKLSAGKLLEITILEAVTEHS